MKENLNNAPLSNFNANFALSNVFDDTCAPPKSNRVCKRCGTKMNYMNSKVSRYCHCCKLKAIREQDMYNKINYGENQKSYKTKITGAKQ